MLGLGLGLGLVVGVGVGLGVWGTGSGSLLKGAASSMVEAERTQNDVQPPAGA